jgi:hypothetical protein
MPPLRGWINGEDGFEFDAYQQALALAEAKRVRQKTMMGKTRHKTTEA